LASCGSRFDSARDETAGHHPCFGDLSPGVTQMLDIIMLAMGLGFFALSVGYAYACDRL
jgi:hypothetical protein